MRRGLAAAAVALSVALTGCGGGDGGTGQAGPGPLLDLHVVTKVTVDVELAKEGVDRKVVACVNRNIAAMSKREIAERVVQSAPADVVESESELEKLGPLGKGCR